MILFLASAPRHPAPGPAPATGAYSMRFVLGLVTVLGALALTPG